MHSCSSLVIHHSLPFVKIHNSGCPGYNNAYSFRNQLVPLYKNRANKIDNKKNNFVAKYTREGHFPAIWRPLFPKLLVPPKGTKLSKLLSHQNTKWQQHLWTKFWLLAKNGTEDFSQEIRFRLTRRKIRPKETYATLEKKIWPTKKNIQPTRRKINTRENQSKHE